MDNTSYTIRVPKRLGRIAAIVGVLALIVAPLAAVATHSFNDVPNSHTFHGNIEWLKASGVTKGCNPPANTLFCPDDNVTRGQMAAFMERFAEYLSAEDGTPELADHATTAGDADTLDGMDSADFASSDDTSGVAQSVNADNAVTVGPGDPLTVIEQVTIDAPTNGFVLVNAVSQIDMNHVTGTTTWANYGVSTSAGSLPGNQDVVILANSALPTGRQNWPGAAHGVFEVSAGANTFYLLIDHNSGAAGSSFDVWDVGLSAVFIPDAYGTVETAGPAAQSSGETETD